ncbi:hypothetical protein EYF80_045677 [Liparis tanakae]|uniref:Uncharacterized protein n=1 Tax=Liparis tanakae TaxID=230148 RepID=A0A4Z2FSE7_9TELE|nr:hypothetical protein EYF80_045677 [Liparis tanakae]
MPQVLNKSISPGPGGHGGLDEALADHLLEPRVELKVLNASVHRDEDLGKLHVPLLQHQPQDALRPRVVGQAHILGHEKRRITGSGERQRHKASLGLASVCFSTDHSSSSGMDRLELSPSFTSEYLVATLAVKPTCCRTSRPQQHLEGEDQVSSVQ